MTQEQINGLIGTINSQKQTIDACLNKLRAYETALEAAEKALMDCSVRLANNGIADPETLEPSVLIIRAAKGGD